MTIEDRNNKLKHYIKCLKCEVSGTICSMECSTQYEAGNSGEIIENLEAISKHLEHEAVAHNTEFNLQSFYEKLVMNYDIVATHKLRGHLCQIIMSNDRTIFHVFINEQKNVIDRVHIYK